MPSGDKAMENQICYLCRDSSTIGGADYGRRQIVRCSKCGYYEVEVAAAKLIQSEDFGSRRREEFRSTLLEIARQGRQAEIVVSGDKILIRGRPVSE